MKKRVVLSALLMGMIIGTCSCGGSGSSSSTAVSTDKTDSETDSEKTPDELENRKNLSWRK